jgi:hypothetical protein
MSKTDTGRPTDHCGSCTHRFCDDYVFPVPDGGYSSVTVDVLGPDTDHLSVEAWLQGYEAPARQTLVSDLAPCQGPLLPMHPYGFARWKRLET